MKRLLVLLVLIACTAQAEIYKTKNEAGEWAYSDTPSPDAERMKLPPLSTYTPVPIAAPSAPASDPADASDTYESMVFVEPKDDATIRDNQGTVLASVRLEPLLKGDKGHKIQFYLDGSPHGTPVTNSNLALKNIGRGAHSLGARVLNADGKPLLSADPVSFFLHRQSVNFPPRVKPTPLPRAN